MQRRQLLRIGAGASAVLAIAAGGFAWWHPGWLGDRLSPDGRTLFTAVGLVVLDGLLPGEPAARQGAMAAHLDRLETAIRGFPPATQAELSQLITVLMAAPGRIVLAGLTASWSAASTDEVARALATMRSARTQLPQQAYHALRDLTNAAWFADPAHAEAIGYPGPRRL